jgi:hypothetical protein
MTFDEFEGKFYSRSNGAISPQKYINLPPYSIIDIFFMD